MSMGDYYDDGPSMGQYEEWYGLCEAAGKPADDLPTRHSKWLTMDKKKIAVKDMTDSHLLNTIRVLRGHSLKHTLWCGPVEMRRHWLNVMANEAYRRKLEIDPLTEQEFEHE
jgi:hypothetical protein